MTKEEEDLKNYLDEKFQKVEETDEDFENPLEAGNQFRNIKKLHDQAHPGLDVIFARAKRNRNLI
jgi:hypothetical protein